MVVRIQKLTRKTDVDRQGTTIPQKKNAKAPIFGAAAQA